jgi:hypothetical protein
MDKDVLFFKGMNPDKEFIEKIFHFDVRKLEAIDGIEISKYCIALSQYLIFLKYQMNKTKSEVLNRKRLVEGTIDLLLTKKLIKDYGTKTNAVAHIMSTSKKLIGLNNEMEPLKDELVILEGMDKVIGELIASFKRELTRRENELYRIRQERKL